MRALVVIYSKTFNTFKVANRVKEELSADLVRIEAGREHSYLVSCVMAFMGWRTRVKPCNISLKDYDLLVLCCPVWSWSTPPAVNEYMRLLANGHGKKCAFVVTYGSSGSHRAVHKVWKKLEKKGLYCIDSLEVPADQVGNGAYYSAAERFARGLKGKAMVPVPVAKVAAEANHAVSGVKVAARSAGKVGRFLLRR